MLERLNQTATEQPTSGARLRIVVAIADELAACPDFETFCRRAVELPRQRLGIDRCALFLLEGSTNRLVGTYGTDDLGRTTDEHRLSFEFDDRPEPSDLPDRAWKRVERDHMFWDGARWRVMGSGWVVGHILYGADGPIGVFYNDNALTGTALNEGIQDALVGYCALLGSMIEHRAADERERRMTRALAAILEAADELIVCPDFDVLYRRAVELARDKLGLERCGIFLLDPAREYMCGTYATDDRGLTTDEHEVKWPAADIPQLFSGGDRWIFMDTRHAFRDGELIREGGGGWVAFTFIRVGNDPIGVLTNDAASSYSSPSEVTQKSVALYCSLLGVVIRRLRAELQREQLFAELAAKNAELERFTYTVSHDLKSPLITIRGFLGFVEKDALAGNAERLQADIQRIGEATTKMQLLLDELLELSRVGRIANPVQQVPFGAMAQEALALVAGRIAERGALVSIQEDLPTVRGDRARLVEVVQNLVDNAVKFLGTQPAPRVEIGTRRDGDETVFFVRDNGVGIEPRYHERVFGLFDKLDPHSDGTGVGLALVKRIIEVHGGRIWVESEGADRGATFCFTLAAEEGLREATGTRP